MQRFLEPPRCLAQLQEMRHGASERLPLIVVQTARPVVDDAERPDRLTLDRPQRNSRVEPDEGLADDERIVGEPRYETCVAYLEDVRAEDRMCTERYLPVTAEIGVPQI